MNATPAYEGIYRERVYENQGLMPLVSLVDSAYRRVLDVGCGSGDNMDLLAARGHSVTGVTLSVVEAERCASRGLRCVVTDLTKPLPFPRESFDALIMSHVLEHLPDPASVLRRLLECVVPGGGIYVALPNVLHLVQRYEFLRGHFQYTETGLMDRTHLRFFDYHSARDLVEGAGVRISRHFGVGQMPLGPLRVVLPGLARTVDALASRRYPGLFGFHIIIAGTRR